MPPVMPSRTRRPWNGRMAADGGAPTPLRLAGATTRHDLVVDVAARQLLERARGELLLARAARDARELVQDARVLRGHEHREVLVRGVLGDLVRREDLHAIASR